LHTDLLAFYSKHYAKDKSDFSKDKYLYLNQLLKSAIRNGDFLNLDSLIYITDRLLDKLPEETAAIFLSNYYECCGLFHFFEIDTPLALKEIRQVLEREPEESELYERCLKYLFSMLIATHLSGVAIEEMQKRLNGKFRNDPFFDIISILVAVEQHNSTEYVLSLIDNAKDRVQFNIKQNEGNVPQLKDYLLAINQLEAFIQHKPYISGVANLLPSNSEMILRIDLWIHAKQENKFYYNLLLQDTWLNRKQVF
jgi:hypothetical protein